MCTAFKTDSKYFKLSDTILIPISAGPYMFPLYSDAYNFTDRIVAMLFVFGFTAGGISAPYVGKWADLQ